MHLIDSNYAWGQDLLFLKEWYESHPEARPLRAALFGWIDPRIADIEISLPPVGPSKEIEGGSFPGDLRQLGPLPGWYAIDANFLHGTHFRSADGNGKWQRIPRQGMNFEYFLRLTPVERVGSSIFIYRVTMEDANQLRSTLKLPLIEPPLAARGESLDTD